MSIGGRGCSATGRGIGGGSTVACCFDFASFPIPATFLAQSSFFLASSRWFSLISASSFSFLRSFLYEILSCCCNNICYRKNTQGTIYTTPHRTKQRYKRNGRVEWAAATFLPAPSNCSWIWSSSRLSPSRSCSVGARRLVLGLAMGWWHGPRAASSSWLNDGGGLVREEPCVGLVGR